MTAWEWIATIVLGIPGAVAIIMLVGMVIEGYGKRGMEIERCRITATTPAEYHRC